MALKTPLKLKNAPKKPKRMYQPLPKVQPLSTATPGAPTGNVERWLVTHKQTGGVLSVVWDHYWFGARARAEWVHKLSRDNLELRHMPQFEDEKSREHGLSGEMLAERLGMKMHVERVVKDVEPPATVRHDVLEQRPASRVLHVYVAIVARWQARVVAAGS